MVETLRCCGPECNGEPFRGCAGHVGREPEVGAPAIKLRERDSTRHSRVVRLGVATSTHPSTRRASWRSDEILRERRTVAKGQNGHWCALISGRRRNIKLMQFTGLYIAALVVLLFSSQMPKFGRRLWLPTRKLRASKRY